MSEEAEEQSQNQDDDTNTSNTSSSSSTSSGEKQDEPKSGPKMARDKSKSGPITNKGDHLPKQPTIRRTFTNVERQKIYAEKESEDKRRRLYNPSSSSEVSEASLSSSSSGKPKRTSATLIPKPSLEKHISITNDPSDEEFKSDKEYVPLLRKPVARSGPKTRSQGEPDVVDIIPKNLIFHLGVPRKKPLPRQRTEAEKRRAELVRKDWNPPKSMENYYSTDDLFKRNHTSPVTKENIKDRLEGARKFFKGALKVLYQERKPGDMNPDRYVNEIMSRKKRQNRRWPRFPRLQLSPFGGGRH